jgi:hypothetical protein
LAFYGLVFTVGVVMVVVFGAGVGVFTGVGVEIVGFAVVELPLLDPEELLELGLFGSTRITGFGFSTGVEGCGELVVLGVRVVG